MQPKATGVHKKLKEIHNIHTGSKKVGGKHVSLKKETTHGTHAGLKHHSKKSNVGRKKMAHK